MNAIQENWIEIHAEAEKRAGKLGIPAERVQRLELMLMPGIERRGAILEENTGEMCIPTTTAHEMMAGWAFGIDLIADVADTFGLKNRHGERLSREYLWQAWEESVIFCTDTHAQIALELVPSIWETYKAMALAGEL